VEGARRKPDSGELVLGYGRGEVRLDLSHHADVEILLPEKTSNTEPVESLLRRSLDNPVGSESLGDLASGAKSVTIAIPDKTRPPVSKDVLPLLVEYLGAAGVPASGVKIFVCCGIHARHTDDEIRDLVGDDLFEMLEIHQNDGHRLEDFENLGTTSRGTRVDVNRVLAGSELIVVIGGLAFHYFAGFTGGRKMIIPGAASVNTVENNHRLTLMESGEMNPGCRSGALEGNPVHEDMVEAVAYLPGRAYLVNVIRDGWGAVAGVTSGDLTRSHLEGTGLVRDLFECHIERPCDVAIAGAGGYPFDVNLIQSHKSLGHAAASVRDGGVLIGVLACEEGIGSDTFLPWFKYGGSGEVTRSLYDNYELNGHTALSFLQKRERVNMILVTELGGDVVERLGVARAEDVNEALRMADAVVGRNARVYVFPRAWGLLPVVKS
jgi:nickel-dependent lactate racemase